MKLKTLIVEDESSLLELLKFNFIKDGFKVDTATDGEMALEKILNKAPDLLILDWMLPKLSGIELCRRIRKNKELKNLSKVFAYSNSGEGVLINKDYTKGLLLRGYLSDDFKKLSIVKNDNFFGNKKFPNH